MSAVSSTILSTLPYALVEERHFALVDGFALSNLGSLRIVRVRKLSPTQPSLRSLTAIMITCSNSPGLGSGMPNHDVGDLLSAIAMSGLSRVRTELLRQAVVAALPPHPVQMHRQLPCHRHLGNLSSAPHSEVEKPTAPLRLTAHRDLRRFH